MPIPVEILSVKRPVNTVVIAYGSHKQLYAVRKRTGCRYVAGRHVPVNGPTIGHIVNGEYVPLASPVQPGIACAPVDLKDWANISLCHKVSMDILPELSRIYSQPDAVKIYCIAVLRVNYPGIKDYELQERYETSFLSELYPGVALSRNTVSTFLNGLGKACSLITAFMQSRVEAVHADHHLLVDGTPKSDESKVNTLSDFSRKARTKGTRDISLLYAFDLELGEPTCSQCFPGNALDLASYEDFITRNNITQGLLVGDKGFPANAAEAPLLANPKLHYLNPVKRNSKLIATHDMHNLTGLLDGHEGVTFRKEKCAGKNKWLYGFRDSRKAAKEEFDWLRRTGARDGYSSDEFRSKRESFGLIVLECDLDLEPECVYRAYSRRWEIEIVMRYYKTTCEFDETRAQDDYSVIGSEFCNFLATVFTFRLLKVLDKEGLLKERNYGSIMAILRRAKKVRLDGLDWQLIRMNPSHIELLQKLKLLPAKEELPKKKPGRPKKRV